MCLAFKAWLPFTGPGSEWHVVYSAHVQVISGEVDEAGQHGSRVFW